MKDMSFRHFQALVKDDSVLSIQNNELHYYEYIYEEYERPSNILHLAKLYDPQRE